MIDINKIYKVKGRSPGRGEWNSDKDPFYYEVHTGKDIAYIYEHDLILQSKSKDEKEANAAKQVLEYLEKDRIENAIGKLRESLKRGSKIQQLRQIQRDRRRLYGK